MGSTASARARFATHERRPFFELVVETAAAHGGPVAAAVDIGPGESSFADMVTARFPGCQVTLLEGNPASVEQLRASHPDTRHYVAPAPLPLPDRAVDLLHTSHLVEHLQPAELYGLLGEMDRVLRPGGVLAISAPLLWRDFYHDMSHVKPYNPQMFERYLCRGHGSTTRAPISQGYTVLAREYRLRSTEVLDGVVAETPAGARLLRLARRGLRRLGIHRMDRTGFTLVLRKGTDG